MVGPNAEALVDPEDELKPLPKMRAFVDCVILLVTAFLVEGSLRMIGPYQRGFFCDDETIRLPYKTSTVPVSMLLFYWPILTSFMFLSVEYFRLTHSTISNQHLAACEQGRCLRTRLMVRFAILNGYFLLALVSTHILTGVTKFSVGRLRPHFIDVCQPSVNLSDCSVYSHQYITSFECLSEEPWYKLMETRLSFFSGHAAFSMCAVTFCVLYLQRRLGGLWKRRIFAELTTSAHPLNRTICVLFSHFRPHAPCNRCVSRHGGWLFHSQDCILYIFVVTTSFCK
uniref:Phosphatidic acid phosphatase type 2/haloperoxidase domain-containing protein n=1 Tax=Ditylenchus dipsaci TaxID=166011 RepID=A0A915EJZ8_9BILA